MDGRIHTDITWVTRTGEWTIENSILKGTGGAKERGQKEKRTARKKKSTPAAIKKKDAQNSKRNKLENSLLPKGYEGT